MELVITGANIQKKQYKQYFCEEKCFFFKYNRKQNPLTRQGISGVLIKKLCIKIWY